LLQNINDLEIRLGTGMTNASSPATNFVKILLV
jgi:hypothetical protein